MRSSDQVCRKDRRTVIPVLDAQGAWRGRPDIEPHLTPRNKKTILKGVYTFLQDQGLDEVAR